MITITDAVEHLLQENEVAYEAMREGILDKTEFAKKIQKDVETQTFKKVSINTIIVSLARIINRPTEIPPLKPIVPIDSIEFLTPIYDVAFEKTPQLLEKLKAIDVSQFMKSGSYFILMQGTANVAIICSQEFKDTILTYFDQKPLYQKNNLTGMIIKNPPETIDLANSQYTLHSRFAMKRINLAELIPVGHELIVIFPPKYMEEVIEAFKDYFGK